MLGCVISMFKYVPRMLSCVISMFNYVPFLHLIRSRLTIGDSAIAGNKNRLKSFGLHSSWS